MIRFSLLPCDTVSDCVTTINALISRFIKDNQRKPICDLLVSTTYAANDIAVKPEMTAQIVHEITLMVDSKIERETDAAKLKTEIAWFRAQVEGVS